MVQKASVVREIIQIQLLKILLKWRKKIKCSQRKSVCIRLFLYVCICTIRKLRILETRQTFSKIYQFNRMVTGASYSTTNWQSGHNCGSSLVLLLLYNSSDIMFSTDSSLLLNVIDVCWRYVLISRCSILTEETLKRISIVIPHGRTHWSLSDPSPTRYHKEDYSIVE